MSGPPPGSTLEPGPGPSRDELRLASRPAGAGLRLAELSVPAIRCGGCMRTVERALRALDGIAEARVNLTARRVAVRWREAAGPPPVLETLAALGYPAHVAEPDATAPDLVLGELLRALAVAGFAAANIMLLSVSVWSGAEPELRNVFHWISAAIALPALAYSGRVFFRPAWAALRRGRSCMEVPISVGVLLACAMSLYDTAHHGEHAYFDAAVMLLFFLLIGRTLDHLMREKARSAVTGLARLAPRGAMVERSDGTHSYLPLDRITPGTTVLVATGERVPVDGRVLAGRSELDCSLVTGESVPRAVAPGAELQGGTLNLTGPLRLEATAAARESFLAEMVRLLEAAEAGRSGYRRVADRAAGLYAPIVHVLAFASFVGWLVVAGDLHQAVSIAVAVLVITCPCALGLAVPMVHVVAARRLFENGVLLKDGTGLERLGEIDTVVFDKTGTLTLGQPRLCDGWGTDPSHFRVAAAMAAHSRHPHSRALAAAYEGREQAAVTFDRVAEHPGDGVEAVSGTEVYRLGRAEWALADPGMLASPSSHPRAVLSRNGERLAAFAFDDPVRPGAREAIGTLNAHGIAVEILSGDHPASVGMLARDLGVARASAEMRPGDKLERLGALADEGNRVLMVGDGLNDAPALGRAHVSMAPASGADVGRNAADFVFLRDDLEAMPLALETALRAGRLVRQNLALAALYNAIALPFAVLGFVTPLVAALAMSSSSILVVANAMRLNGGLASRWRLPIAAASAGQRIAPAMEAAH